MWGKPFLRLGNGESNNNNIKRCCCCLELRKVGKERKGGRLFGSKMSGSAKSASRLKLFKNGCRSEGGKVSIEYSMIDGAGVSVLPLSCLVECSNFYLDEMKLKEAPKNTLA